MSKLPAKPKFHIEDNKGKEDEKLSKNDSKKMLG
jgi:hypothetical protein